MIWINAHVLFPFFSCFSFSSLYFFLIFSYLFLRYNLFLLVTHQQVVVACHDICIFSFPFSFFCSFPSFTISMVRSGGSRPHGLLQSFFFLLFLSFLTPLPPLPSFLPFSSSSLFILFVYCLLLFLSLALVIPSPSLLLFSSSSFLLFLNCLHFCLSLFSLSPLLPLLPSSKLLLLRVTGTYWCYVCWYTDTNWYVLVTRRRSPF